MSFNCQNRVQGKKLYVFMRRTISLLVRQLHGLKSRKKMMVMMMIMVITIIIMMIRTAGNLDKATYLTYKHEI
jgi:hypothetical protein